MFTGLVRERGRILSDPEPVEGGGVVLRVGLSPELGSRLGIGASLAVAGVCLTVVHRTDLAVVVELSAETLRRTNLGSFGVGAEVNLEPALAMGDPLGGHWVQGHVDDTLSVVGVEEQGEHRWLTVELPDAHRPFVVEKGSVTLDGVSLTVARLEHERFSIALVPHTLEVTTLGSCRVGDRLNFEVDVLAKYVAHAVAAYLPRGGS